jgi:multidrug efflux pump subunit AcrA (membrane-fusion protein)
MKLTTLEARIKGQERVFARILMISFRPRYRKHEAKISVTSSGLGGGARIASRPPSGRTRNRQASGRRSNLTASFAVGLGAVLMVSAAVVFILRDKMPVVEVATLHEDRGGRSALLNASGYITPRQRATIAAKITGRVNAIFAEEGVHVQPGQVLATLDDVDARARLASVGADRDATAAALGDLRIDLANAERELWRMEVLRARELVSQQDRDQARIAAASPRARIGLASAPANRCRLREL